MRTEIFSIPTRSAQKNRRAHRTICCPTFLDLSQLGRSVFKAKPSPTELFTAASAILASISRNRS